MNAIANITPDWGIGKNGQLLVRIREDLDNFKLLTSQKTIIYGRKTLETFPNAKPLPNRKNIIFSKDPKFTQPGAEICHSLDELKTLLAKTPTENICVIGGESIYKLLLPYCRKAFITVTFTEMSADRFFPNLDNDPNWYPSFFGQIIETATYPIQFLEYINRNPKEL